MRNGGRASSGVWLAHCSDRVARSSDWLARGGGRLSCSSGGLGSGLEQVSSVTNIERFPASVLMR